MQITPQEYQQKITKKIENGDYDDNIERAILARLAVDILIARASSSQKSESEGSSENKERSDSGNDKSSKEGSESAQGSESEEGSESAQGSESEQGSESSEGSDYSQGNESEEDSDNTPNNFDHAACDRTVKPEIPSLDLMDLLRTLPFDAFNKVISTAQMEFLGVYRFDKTTGISATPVYVGYAKSEKGAVEVPSELLSVNETYVVTHNHPNAAAFSDADFRIFNRYPSIVYLHATTLARDYIFSRARQNVRRSLSDRAVNMILSYLQSTIREQIDSKMLEEDSALVSGMREAKAQGRLQEFFNCTKIGASFFAEATIASWDETFQEVVSVPDGIDFFVTNKDLTADGEFGTSNNSTLTTLAKRLYKQGLKGLSEDAEQNEATTRHKAPYSDDEGYYSPAYDVSKSFGAEIYSLPFAKALQRYGDGLDADAEALQILRSLHNKPDAKVKIYRAVEKGLRDQISDLKQDRKYMTQKGSVPPWADVPPNTGDEYTEFVEAQIDNLGSVDGASIQPSINVRDWVTLTKRYAEDHGELAIPNGFTVISKTVMAKDLFTDGNSIHEFGYDPKHDQETMSGMSFDPPKAVQEEAARGLEWRREFDRGGTYVGVARARDLSNGRAVSLDTVKRMKAYFDRHQVDKNAEGFRLGEDGYPTAGRIAWALWGGDVGYHWAKSIVSKHGDGLGFIEPTNELAGKVEETQSQPEQKEVAPLTTKDVVNMEPPEALPLTGELKEFLSNMLAKFNMLIWGSAGSGKSSFVLRLANELAETDTGRVLYFMTEEKVASGRLKARMDLMKAYSENINFDDQGTFDRLTALVNTGMYRYVIVDSINMINVEQQRIVELMQTFPEVSWIFIAQATKGKNAYAGIQALAHAVDTEIATTNEKGTGMAELKKHRDGPLKSHTIFGNQGMRDPRWTKQW